MSEDQAREQFRDYVASHFGALKVAADALFVSVAHLSHMLTGRKRLNDRALRMIGLRRVETLERVE